MLQKCLVFSVSCSSGLKQTYTADIIYTPKQKVLVCIPCKYSEDIDILNITLNHRADVEYLRRRTKPKLNKNFVLTTKPCT